MVLRIDCPNTNVLTSTLHGISRKRLEFRVLTGQIQFCEYDRHSHVDGVLKFKFFIYINNAALIMKNTRWFYYEMGVADYTYKQALSYYCKTKYRQCVSQYVASV